MVLGERKWVFTSVLRPTTAGRTRKTIWEFALSAMAYDGFTAPKTSLLEQYLAEVPKKKNPKLVGWCKFSPKQ